MVRLSSRRKKQNGQQRLTGAFGHVQEMEALEFVHRQDGGNAEINPPFTEDCLKECNGGFKMPMEKEDAWPRG